MYDWQFFGTFDLARISLWLFWLFFAGLVIWIQRENQREGYPLENDDGSPAGSLWPTPEAKTFHLYTGGSVQSPPEDQTERDLPLARTGGGGFPFAPTGDGLVDGVGPASWANRQDVPELDAHGHAKIQPMSAAEGFHVAAGRDPRGLPVASPDLKSPGKIVDLWVDVPEQVVRYLEVALEDGSTRLIPMPLCKIKSDRVVVGSLPAARYHQVPQVATAGGVTKLEEDKISGFFAGGPLFTADEQPSRLKALGDMI